MKNPPPSSNSGSGLSTVAITGLPQAMHAWNQGMKAMLLAFVILTLAAGSIAAHFLLQDNGYVLINFRGYAVEMSVPVLLFLLIYLLHLTEIFSYYYSSFFSPLKNSATKNVNLQFKFEYI